MADRDITVRFFQVIDLSDNPEPLEDALQRIGKKPVKQREREVGSGLALRLEHVEQSGELWLGEITRTQTENLPAHVTATGTDPLAVANLGHPVAFCYDTKAKAVAVQFDPKVRVGRVMQYFTEISGLGKYSYLPILTEASIEDFGKQTIKSLDVTVSKVKLFSAALPNKTDFEDSIDDMTSMFDAPRISVKLSTRTGSLKRSAVVSAVKKLLKVHSETETVKKIKATTEEEEEVYDFLEQLMVERGTLTLLDNLPNDNRKKRIDFLKTSYGKRKKHIRAALGATD